MSARAASLRTICRPASVSKSTSIERLPRLVVEGAAAGRGNERRPPAAGVVARAGALDLDHVGAEIGENLPGPWTRQDAGKLKHADTGQRTKHEVTPSPRNADVTATT
jgi:hypothetical protein